MSSYSCGWCNAPFQDLTQPQSLPQSPLHSFNCIPPGGKGAAGKGKGKGKASFQATGKGKGAAPPLAQAGQQVKQVAPVDLTGTPPQGGEKKETFFQKRARQRSRTAYVVPEKDQAMEDNAELAELREELQVLNAMLASIKDSTSAASQARRVELEAAVTEVQHKLTKTKTLETQFEILQSCVQRRQKQVEARHEELEAAQKALLGAKLSLDDAQSELANIQDMLDNQSAHGTAPVTQDKPVEDMIQLAKKSLPPSHIQGFLECIELMKKAAAANAQPLPASQTPILIQQSPEHTGMAKNDGTVAAPQTPIMGHEPLSPPRRGRPERSRSPGRHIVCDRSSSRSAGFPKIGQRSQSSSMNDDEIVSNSQNIDPVLRAFNRTEPMVPTQLQFK